MDFIANGLASKARAIYANRLTSEDYAILLKQASVSDVTNYLKMNTYYADGLKAVNVNTVHRGQLETLLRQASFFRKVGLQRYVSVKTKPFYQTIVEIADVDQILASIRALLSDDYQVFVAELPLFLNAYTSFDLRKLLQVKNMSDLRLVLADTMYFDVLKEYLSDDCDYAKCEHALKSFYFKRLTKVIDQTFHGQTKKELMLMIEEVIDLKNLSKIYRIKKYFDDDEKALEDFMMDAHSHFTKAERISMMNVTNVQQLSPILKSSHYHIEIDNFDDIGLEHCLTQAIYDRASKAMFYANDAAIIYLAFGILQAIEVKNLVNIVEGVRYKLDQQKIKQLLVY